MGRGWGMSDTLRPFHYPAQPAAWPSESWGSTGDVMQALDARYPAPLARQEPDGFGSPLQPFESVPVVSSIAQARSATPDVKPLDPYVENMRPFLSAVRDSGIGTAIDFAAPALSQGMFLTPFRVANLESAGFIKPGGWRSLRALERAREAMKLGANPRDVWEEFGWNVAGNDPWGKIQGRFQVGDFAPLDTSDLRVVGAGSPRTLSEAVSGRTADELFAADPRLASVPIKYKATKDELVDGVFSPGTRQLQTGSDMVDILGDQVPGTYLGFSNVRPGDPVFDRTFLHELAHAINHTSMPKGGPAVPFSGRDLPDQFSASHRVAEAPFYARSTEDAAAAKRALSSASMGDAGRDALRIAHDIAVQARNQAIAQSNYHNARHEMSAREGQHRVGMTLDRQRQTPVGTMPMFTEDTLPAFSIIPNNPDMVARGIALGDLEIPYKDFRRQP